MKTWHRFALSGLSGAILFLCFEFFDLWPLAWIALIPLLFAIYNLSGKRAFFIGWVCGIVYALSMTYWIIPLHPYANFPIVFFAFLFLTAYVSLYVAIFSYVITVIKTRNNLINIFFAASIWTLLEFVRGSLATGYPWNILGYSQYKFVQIVQIASITGVSGVSFLLVLINAALALFILNSRNWKKEIKFVLIPIMFLCIVYTFGILEVNKPLIPDKEINIALIPGNIKQETKINSNLSAEFRLYLDEMDNLSTRNLDLIVFPETFVLANLLSEGRSDYLAILQGRLKETRRSLLFGTGFSLSEGGIEKSYNTAALLTQKGIVARYFKQHLVPFSEYTPFSKYLPENLRNRIAGIADWNKGEESVVMELSGNTRFGVVICFESVFPKIFRSFYKKGVDFMGIITNDAWFEGTSASNQHFAAAPLRAIEMRRSIFHCANKGVTAIINPIGQVISKTILSNDTGVVVSKMPVVSNKTLYMRFGDWFILFCIAYVLFTLFHKRINRKFSASSIRK
jgi:apolipoprotein N-acyltransferase